MLGFGRVEWSGHDVVIERNDGVGLDGCERDGVE